MSSGMSVALRAANAKTKSGPKKHGPYYQLSLSVKGRSSSFFVRKQDLGEARRRIQRYKRFRELNKELTQAYVDSARQNGFMDSETYTLTT